MVSNAIPLLCLLAVVVSQNVQKNVKAAINDIFGTPSINSVALKPCTTPDGKVGDCVPYYNCVNVTMDTGGDYLIDIRSYRPCKTLETCCPLPDITYTMTTPQPPIITPGKGCGYRNPDGLGFKTTGDVNRETKFAEFPWMCGILRVTPAKASNPGGRQRQVYVGGGSLIHPSVVLTAAHYAVKPNLKVRAGEWDTQTTLEPYPYQERDVGSVEIHQDYNSGNLFYDIGLLFLTQPMELAPNVALVCLPPPPKQSPYSTFYIIQRVPDGTKCFTTGWGKEKFEANTYQAILKKVEVPVVNHATCEAQLQGTRLKSQFRLNKCFMCAGGERGQDTCTGDGGSPLSCPIEFEENRYMQSGIVSWGIGCGTDGVPGVYVDVAFVRKWVDDKVSGRGYDPKVYTY